VDLLISSYDAVKIAGRVTFSIACPDAVGLHLRGQSMETHLSGHGAEHRPVRRPDIRRIHIRQVRCGFISLRRMEFRFINAEINIPRARTRGNVAS